MKDKLNTLWAGSIIGILIPIIGFLIYGLSYSAWQEVSFRYFFQNLFMVSPSLQSALISICLIFNLLAFFPLLNRGYNKGAQGVILATFLYGGVIIYLKFL